MVWRHRFLCLVLVGATAFALSDRVFLFDIKVVDMLDLLRSLHVLAPSQTVPEAAHPVTPINPSIPRALQLLATFRSSGRMFWLVYYAALLFSLVIVLRCMAFGSALPFVAVCCLLQLADTEPLRARLTALTRHETPPLLELAAWQARAQSATRVIVDPSFVCSSEAQKLPNIELQLAAVRVGRPINSVYNPRLVEDCAAVAERNRKGPWQDDTL